jgi:hypothetical protein
MADSNEQQQQNEKEDVPNDVASDVDDDDDNEEPSQNDDIDDLPEDFDPEEDKNTTPDDDNYDYGYYGEDDDCADDNDVEDDCADADQEIYRTFFEQLIAAKKKSVQEARDARFIPSTQRYLQASFEDRAKLLTPVMIQNLLFLMQNIVSGQITMTVNDVELEMMDGILNKNTTKNEIRLHLLEDRRLHIYLLRALKLIQNSQNGRKRKETNHAGQREIQRPGGVTTSGNKSAKNTRRHQPYARRSRIVGESSRHVDGRSK